MRARDFLIESDEAKSVTINIPITITIPAGGGMPSVGTIAAPAGKDLPDDPVYVSPLQQELELLKQQGGKKSRIINQIVRDDGADSRLGDSKDYFDLSEDYDELQNHYDHLIENADPEIQE
jgi:hypothetical protein